jgi:beta-barrel assembly-enhancing protease
MTHFSRRLMAVLLATILLPGGAGAMSAAELTELVARPYLALAQESPSLSFTHAELDEFRKQLDKQRKSEKERLIKEEKELDKRLGELRDQLASLNREASTDSPKSAEVRRNVHCEILRLEKTRREKRVERETGMPVAFDNKLAKVDLIEKWPTQKISIAQTIADGKARQRTLGDIEDIGIRKVGADQEKDIKLGEEALRDLKLHSLMPLEFEGKEVKEYVQSVADRIATNSDVKVPVKLTILHSEEINAFALPGGFLFVNTGLINRTASESELAGVIAHELAHVSARHGARLMKRANIAGLMYQMVQIAVMVGTGGFGTIGTYYLFQAGFLGLGLVLDLTLLGVSREFEAEADQLGAQYAWKAGYDPRGFITFFDTMAAEKGYIRSASFFRTHPPFFERIISTLSEIEYLPTTDALGVTSSAFQQMKKQLSEGLRREEQRKKDAPTLHREPDCEDKKEKSGVAACAVCEGAV